MTEVRLEGLVKQYPGKPPVLAVNGVSLTVKSGSLTAVLGASGSGKTTLLRLIAGFEQPDAGTVTFDGRVVGSRTSSLPPERRHVGIVPQEGALFPHLSVAGNVAFGLRHLSRAAARDRVGQMLELVGLAGLAHRRPSQLSGGQQQRVALARALAPEPGIVLLDEPFAALDAELRGSLRAEVVEALTATHTTAVLVTHDRAEAMTMADRIAVMRDGELVQVGEPASVYSTPVDVPTARLLGEANILRSVANGAQATSVLGTLPITGDWAPGTPVDLLVRPEHIERVEGGGGSHATVHAVNFHGYDALVLLDIGDQQVLCRLPAAKLPHVGTTVSIAVRGTAVAYPVSV